MNQGNRAHGNPTRPADLARHEREAAPAHVRLLAGALERSDQVQAEQRAEIAALKTSVERLTRALEAAAPKECCVSFGVPLPRIFALDEDGVAEYVIEKDTWRRVCPAWPLQGTPSVSALVPVDSDGFVAFVPIAASLQRAKSERK